TVIPCVGPIVHRSEGFPAQDIWSPGVMAQGPDKMERVVGTPPPSPPPSPDSSWGGGLPPSRTPPLSRPTGLQDSLAGLIE
ncbi:MAG: hypothetical protein VX396_07725, partial [SAR324 cluster bacterium]|nr:hypothetical protein [SAR324 cluster bacterium]